MMMSVLRSVSRVSRWSVAAPNVLLSGQFSTVSDKKAGRTEVDLKESDLQESFVKGSGKGGQKINKVRNCVLLTHVPTGLQVQCQKTRSLDGNRRAARKLLLQKLDDHVNGALSKRSQKIERLRRKKANRRSKSKQKYAKNKATTEEEQDEEEDDEDDDADDGEDEEDDELIDVEEHKFKAKKRAK
ncbi:hypothetical protein PHYBOEH_011770 [Phytophthora boehmeriae]|uniref:Prokaryotic-type class I peptide chain release factors domain-containing protein n=1 Tax=Phytophthora boehmeriae TaxID=109152 RepID=A0A8T1X287_9STRA|nr:hypothetical protein PHYBOEH_011770 [Phytophthora boehmeriae]